MHLKRGEIFSRSVLALQKKSKTLWQQSILILTAHLSYIAHSLRYIRDGFFRGQHRVTITLHKLSRLPILRIENTRHNGFLLGYLDLMGHWWCHYCAVWSWAGVFHHINFVETSTETLPLTRKCFLVQNNRRFDLIYLFRLLLSILSLAYLEQEFTASLSPNLAIDMLILAWCAWRAIDNTIGYIHGTLFGFKNLPTRRESMTLHRAQRRLMLTLIDFIDIVFVYSCIYWLLNTYFLWALYDKPLNTPSSALQLSFSTITTIGYGTYAPSDYRTILVSLSESFAGVLMIGGAIAQMASMLKEYYQPILDETSRAVSESYEGMPVTELELRLRRILPPLISFLIILTIYWASIRNAVPHKQ